jgi:hypothetical protein
VSARTLSCVRADSRGEGGREGREGRGGEGRGGEGRGGEGREGEGERMEVRSCGRTMSAWTLVFYPQVTSKRTLQCI